MTGTPSSDRRAATSSWTAAAFTWAAAAFSWRAATVWASVASWAVVLVVAVQQTVHPLLPPITDRLVDLQVYVGAVRGFLDGRSFYDFAAVGSGAPFTYPPFAGIIMIPLAYVDTAILMVGWTIASVLVVAAIALALHRRPGNLAFLPGKLALPLLTLALLESAPVASNLRFGQVSIVLILLVLLDALNIVPPRYSGIATGIAGAIKLTPLIFIPYLWLTGRRRAAVQAAGTFIAVTLLAAAVLPGESVRFWGTEVHDVNRVGHITTNGNQSLNGAMLRFGWPGEARTLVIAVLGTAIVLLAYWRARRAARNGDLLAGVVVVGAASIAFSPVSWTHHQLWLVLAALIPVSRILWRNLVWAAFVLAVMILSLFRLGTEYHGGILFQDSRLFLAIAVAALVPFLPVRGSSIDIRQDEGTTEPRPAVVAAVKPGVAAAIEPGVVAAIEPGA